MSAIIHRLRTFARDTLSNVVTGLGTVADGRMATQYTYEPMSQPQLEAAFRGDWIARKVVLAPAEDATREWREWQTDQPNIEKLENAEKLLDLQRKMKRALMLARLYGGSAIVMGVNKGSAEDELDIEKVGQDSLKWLAVFHQFELTPGQRIRDINSPWFDRPEYYQLSTDTQNVDKKITSGVRIHPSRVIPLVGAEIPDIRTNGFSTWGDSVLQCVDEAIKATGTVIGGIATMVNDAKMDVIKVPGLTKKMADEDASAELITRFTLANKMKSLVHTLLLDEKEEWERTQTTFASMPQLIQEYLTVAAGAAGIPVSRLLGMSKGKGLSGGEGGGEVDVRNYYDGISSMQKTELSPTITPLDEVFIRSTLGSADDSIYYEWTPLWQLSDTEKAAIALQKAQASQADVTMALVNPDVLRDARINQLVEDGTYPGLQDAVDEHGAEPPEPTPEEMAQQLTMQGKSLPPHLGGPPAFGPDGQKVPAPGMPAKKKPNIGDAAPRTLYVRRDVLNPSAIVAWARGQGIAVADPKSLHVTVVFSRAAVDWNKVPDETWGIDEKSGNLVVRPGGVRFLDMLGPLNDVLALCFTSTSLKWRHESIVREAGASWDYDEYHPHVTLTNVASQIDLKKIEPYRGRIVLGPEIFEEVKSGYGS